MKGHGDVLDNIIADQIASSGAVGGLNTGHHIWNNEETHGSRLQHDEGPTYLPGWKLSVPRLRSMFKKLKKGRASPEGITAEILHNML